jgi:hypothetical protein
MDKPEAHLFASLNDQQQRHLIEAFVRVENKLGKQTRHKLRETTFTNNGLQRATNYP